MSPYVTFPPTGGGPFRDRWRGQAVNKTDFGCHLNVGNRLFDIAAISDPEQKRLQAEACLDPRGEHTVRLTEINHQILDRTKLAVSGSAVGTGVLS